MLIVNIDMVRGRFYEKFLTQNIFKQNIFNTKISQITVDINAQNCITSSFDSHDTGCDVILLHSLCCI